MMVTTRNKICGIYKLTSPSGRVYVGQSVDINGRKCKYKGLQCKEQIRLYKSLKKYGFENHSFEILQECKKEELNGLEILFINLYDSANNGLNLQNGGNSKFTHSPETILKMKVAHKGKKYSLGTRRPLHAIIATALKNKGRKRSEEIRNKYRASKYGNDYGKNNAGKIRTEETREKISKSVKLLEYNGERHPCAKLTNEIVLAIRNKYIPKVYSFRKIAKEFSLSKTHVRDIISRKTWKHI